MNISKHFHWLFLGVCFAVVISVCKAEQDITPNVTKQVSVERQTPITNIFQRGLISTRPANIWEQALVSGNGKCQIIPVFYKLCYCSGIIINY